MSFSKKDGKAASAPAAAPDLPPDFVAPEEPAEPVAAAPESVASEVAVAAVEPAGTAARASSTFVGGLKTLPLKVTPA